MIIRAVQSLRNTERHVKGRTNKNWASLRYLLKQDGWPFSVNFTELDAGCKMEIAYQNHVEACVCISGKGTVYEGSEATAHELYPGVLYALRQGERHMLEATEALVLISIFSPPLVGPEIHDKEGNYPDLTDDN